MCGSWTELLEATGFCATCSVGVGGFGLCNYCHSRPAKNGSSQCWQCKQEIFLSRNADELELLLQEGLALKSAFQVLRNWNRPVCLACGEVIEGGKRTDILCQRTKACKAAKRRLRTLRESFRRKRYLNPHETALEQLKLELEQ